MCFCGLFSYVDGVEMLSSPIEKIVCFDGCYFETQPYFFSTQPPLQGESPREGVLNPLHVPTPMLEQEKQ
jgi:hypothetical protein